MNDQRELTVVLKSRFRAPGVGGGADRPGGVTR